MHDARTIVRRGNAHRPTPATRTAVALVAAAALVATAGALLPGARAQEVAVGNSNASVPEGLIYEQRLDAVIPAALALTDEHGDPAHPSRIAQGRPVVLALVYFDCPMLCNLVVDGLVRALKPLALEPGEDFDVVIASIDPRDDPATARDRERHTLARYGRGQNGAGWHFLTGAEDDVAALADTVGFRYRYLPDSGEYAHPAGIVVLTGEGRVSRYLLGVEHAPRDLRLAIVEAGRGEVGSPVDQLLLLCFRYDPTKGAYGFYAMNAIRAGGVLVLAGLATFVGLALRRERRARRTAAAAAALGIGGGALDSGRSGGHSATEIQERSPCEP